MENLEEFRRLIRTRNPMTTSPAPLPRLRTRFHRFRSENSSGWNHLVVRERSSFSGFERIRGILGQVEGSTFAQNGIRVHCGRGVKEANRREGKMGDEANACVHNDHNDIQIKYSRWFLLSEHTYSMPSTQCPESRRISLERTTRSTQRD